MANHAYVLRCSFTQEQVDELARQFCAGPLKGLFEVRTANDWRMITYKGDDQVGVEYWLTTHPDYGWDEQGKPSPCGDEGREFPEIPAITIRHGHHSDFGWWVDFYWEHYLAAALNGKIVDDCDGVLQTPKVPYDCPTFRSWMDRGPLTNPKEKGILNWLVKKSRLMANRAWLKSYPEIRKAFYDK